MEGDKELLEAALEDIKTMARRQGAEEFRTGVFAALDDAIAIEDEGEKQADGSDIHMYRRARSALKRTRNIIAALPLGEDAPPKE